MELVYLVCEGICGYIALKSQLKLSYDTFVKGNFQSDIGDRDRFREPTLDFKDPEFLWICLLGSFHIFFDAFNGLDDILYSRESAFASNHITDSELKLFFILQPILNVTFVRLLLLFQALLEFITSIVFRLTEHLFFDFL